MERGSLIPKEAADLLAAQDVERKRAQDEIAAMGRLKAYDNFRSNFAASIAYEFDLARKWGACAETITTGYGDEVVKSIKVKYPPRTLRGWKLWLQRFKGFADIPLFQFAPAEGLGGFIFNEGGKGVTLTVTRAVPFRLYVAGIVLMRTYKGKDLVWSLHRMKRQISKFMK